MTSNKEQFDKICNSIRNGLFRQALEQSEQLDGYELASMLDYFTYDLNDIEMAVSFAKAWFRYKER